MQILLTGATGFIGQHLLPLLHYNGHKVRTLSREPGLADMVWEPDTGRIPAGALDNVEAVIHLAGEQVAERWTSAKKERIESSRIKSTQAIVEAILAAPAPSRPHTLITASAIGYYGNRGPEVLNESAGPGRGFLSKVCVQWEAASAGAVRAGVRCVSLRTGIVLSTTGGALPRVMRGMTIHAGGRLGNGKQYMSWVTVEDAIQAIYFLLAHGECSGPYNVVAPQATTNEMFMATLAEILHCHRLIPIPAALAQLTFGPEMANEVLLTSTRAVPEKLTAAGFAFKDPSLKPALEHLVRDRI